MKSATKYYLLCLSQPSLLNISLLLLWGYNFGYVILVWDCGFGLFEISRRVLMLLLSRALWPEDYQSLFIICQNGRSEFLEWVLECDVWFVFVYLISPVSEILGSFPIVRA